MAPRLISEIQSVKSRIHPKLTYCTQSPTNAKTPITYQVAQKCPTGQNAISRQRIETFLTQISGFIAEVTAFNNPENFTEIFPLLQ